MSNDIPHTEPDGSGDYPIGYGRPPAHAQFQEGNKMGRGRPKGTKNFKTIVNEALGAKVPAKINGKTVKLSKAELAMHQLANKASAGDLKAIEKVLALQERFGPQEDPAGPSPEQIKIDLQALADHLALLGMFDDQPTGGGRDG
jgi:hypothetical protein